MRPPLLPPVSQTRTGGLLLLTARGAAGTVAGDAFRSSAFQSARPVGGCLRNRGATAAVALAATDEELLAAFPGADLIPGGKRHATMAVTVDAPPSRVWPWLVQMGCDRAGW